MLNAMYSLGLTIALLRVRAACSVETQPTRTFLRPHDKPYRSSIIITREHSREGSWNRFGRIERQAIEDTGAKGRIQHSSHERSWSLYFFDELSTGQYPHLSLYLSHTILADELNLWHLLLVCLRDRSRYLMITWFGSSMGRVIVRKSVQRPATT